MCAATAYATTAEVDDEPYHYSDDGDFESDDATELDEPETPQGSAGAESRESHPSLHDSAASRDSLSASSYPDEEAAAAPPAAVVPAEASRSASTYSSSFASSSSSSSSEWSEQEDEPEQDDVAPMTQEVPAAGTDNTAAAIGDASGQSASEHHELSSRSASRDEEDDTHAVSYRSDDYEVALPQDVKSPPRAPVEAAASSPQADTQTLATDAVGSHGDDRVQKQAAALDASASSELRRTRRRPRVAHASAPHSARAVDGEDAGLEGSRNAFEPAKVPTSDEELRTLQAENEELYERLYALQRARCKSATRVVGGTMTTTAATSYTTLPSAIGPRGVPGSRPLARKDIAARLVQESLQLDRTMQLLRRDHRELRQRVLDQEQLVARYESATIYHELVETTKKEVAALVEEQRDLQLEMRYNGKLLLMHETVMASGEGDHRLHEELRAQTALAQRTVEQALRSLEETERQRGVLRDRVAALRQELQSRQDSLSDPCWDELRELKTQYRSKHQTAQHLQQRLARVREDRARDAAGPAHPTRQTSSPTRGRCGGAGSPRGRSARQKVAGGTSAPTAGKLHRTSEEAERDYLQERIVYMRSLLQHRRARQGPGQYTEADDTAPSREDDAVAATSHRSSAGGMGRVSFAVVADVVPAEDDTEATDQVDGEETTSAMAEVHDEQGTAALQVFSDQVTSTVVEKDVLGTHVEKVASPVEATPWLEDAVADEPDHRADVVTDVLPVVTVADTHALYPTEHTTEKDEAGAGHAHSASRSDSHNSSVHDDVGAALGLPETYTDGKVECAEKASDEEDKDGPAWLLQEEEKDTREDSHAHAHSTSSAAATSNASSRPEFHSSNVDATVDIHAEEAAPAVVSERVKSASTSASGHALQHSAHAEESVTTPLHEEQEQRQPQGEDIDEVVGEVEESSAASANANDLPFIDADETQRAVTATSEAESAAPVVQPDATPAADDADEEPDWLRF